MLRGHTIVIPKAQTVFGRVAALAIYVGLGGAIFAFGGLARSNYDHEWLKWLALAWLILVFGLALEVFEIIRHKAQQLRQSRKTNTIDTARQIRFGAGKDGDS